MNDRKETRMKIIWICNVPAIQSVEVFGRKRSGGSWLEETCNYIKQECNLTYIYPAFDITQVRSGKGDQVTLYEVPSRKLFQYDSNTKEAYKEIISKEQPDVIHIWGTELAHSLAAVDAAEECGMLDCVVVSIQGLTSIIAKHYYADLPEKVIRAKTLYEFLRKDGIKEQRKKFIARGVLEKKILKKVKYVIGRTDWDNICTRNMNPELVYFKCNETMRSCFYGRQWELEKSDSQRIFISQGSYPIKGLHYAIESFCEVKKKYPDFQVYVGGADLLKQDRLIDSIKQSSYARYIEKQIKEKNLISNIHFLGPLSAEKMLEQYLKARVYVLPSIIENSSNSLCEAMMVGTPVIASDVGGVKSLLEHGKEGFLYQHDAPYMLAGVIEDLFEDDNLCERLSYAERERALKRHDRDRIRDDLKDIYVRIIANV